MATVDIKTEVRNRVEIERSPSLIGVVCADEQRHKGHTQVRFDSFPGMLLLDELVA